ncbi:hypothetical protein NL676_017734 [Syzygium grande]|nr:hypothetical protein NL676_017734 [Syzygium grande]
MIRNTVSKTRERAAPNHEGREAIGGRPGPAGDPRGENQSSGSPMIRPELLARERVGAGEHRGGVGEIRRGPRQLATDLTDHVKKGGRGRNSKSTARVIAAGSGTRRGPDTSDLSRRAPPSSSPRCPRSLWAPARTAVDAAVW